jgi:elongation factor Ts
MANITTDMVKELRERTQAGMLDCKKALAEVDGDMEKAVDYLRKKGLAASAKKAGRVAAEGVVLSYIHPNNRVGVLVEINCETDFVAGTEDFRGFAADMAMQIAAMSPDCVRREDMDTSKIEAERAVLRAKALEEGKKAEIVDKIVDGQINKFYAEKVLLEQKFVKDDKKSIADVIAELVAKCGENVQIRRFARFELGEGIEKKSEDFAAEVAKTIQSST